MRSKWLPQIARVRTCSLREYHPFAQDGGGTVYYLHCRLDYQVGGVPYDTVVTTTSTRSTEVRDEIVDWAVHQRPGAELPIRVNPAAPEELVVEAILPIHQRPTSGDALPGAVAFGILGAILTVTGRTFHTRDLPGRPIEPGAKALQ